MPDPAPQPPDNAIPAAGDPTGPSPAPADPSRIATYLARATLRWSTYPGRSFIGTFWRKRSRRRGGHRFTIRSDDGVRLDGWFSPAPPSAKQAKPGRLPVVMMHGWIEVKEFHFRRAWRLNRAGHDVILFDHRAHGCSDGRSATFGARERHDLAAVAEEARRRGYIERRYITFGYSMGAAVALQHAGSDPNVAGVVAFAPFATFNEAVCSFREKLAPWIDERWLLQGFERAAKEAGFAFDDTSTLEAIKGVEAPVLLVEAARDTNLPPDVHTKKLAAAKTQGSIEVITIDDATHVSITRKPWPGLDKSVNRFCASVT